MCFRNEWGVTDSGHSARRLGVRGVLDPASSLDSYYHIIYISDFLLQSLRNEPVAGAACVGLACVGLACTLFDPGRVTRLDQTQKNSYIFIYEIF